MNRQVHFSTIIGIFLSIGLVLAAIFLGNTGVGGFVDLKSILIVVGGTFFLVIGCFSFQEVWGAKKLIGRTIYYTSEDPELAAKAGLELADLARKNGILSLQKQSKKLNRSPFFKRSILQIVDGIPAEDVERIMQRELAATDERHMKGVAILNKAAEISPAMGLIGTLIGLVQMLANLDDPSSIGPAMAIALLTTLYGAMLAYMIFTPLASKLERTSEEELLVMQIYMQTVMSIGRRENPRRLQMLINSILPPAKRVQFFT